MPAVHNQIVPAHLQVSMTQHIVWWIGYSFQIIKRKWHITVSMHSYADLFQFKREFLSKHEGISSVVMGKMTWPKKTFEQCHLWSSNCGNKTVSVNIKHNLNECTHRVIQIHASWFILTSPRKAIAATCSKNVFVEEQRAFEIKFVVVNTFALHV